MESYSGFKRNYKTYFVSWKIGKKLLDSDKIINHCTVTWSLENYCRSSCEYGITNIMINIKQVVKLFKHLVLQNQIN